MGIKRLKGDKSGSLIPYIAWTIGLDGSGLTQERRAPMMITNEKNPGNGKRYKISIIPSARAWINERGKVIDWCIKIVLITMLKRA